MASGYRIAEGDERLGVPCVTSEQGDVAEHAQTLAIGNPYPSDRFASIRRRIAQRVIAEDFQVFWPLEYSYFGDGAVGVGCDGLGYRFA